MKNPLLEISSFEHIIISKDAAKVLNVKEGDEVFMLYNYDEGFFIKKANQKGGFKIEKSGEDLVINRPILIKEIIKKYDYPKYLELDLNKRVNVGNIIGFYPIKKVK